MADDRAIEYYDSPIEGGIVHPHNFHVTVKFSENLQNLGKIHGQGVTPSQGAHERVLEDEVHGPNLLVGQPKDNISCCDSDVEPRCPDSVHVVEVNVGSIDEEAPRLPVHPAGPAAEGIQEAVERPRIRFAERPELCVEKKFVKG
jgi:hypothetical protein